ncbi:hypothetical protein COO60DRAFT_1100064 [Scenedesmus sp. NREL 46B-D3]|nr:hypothetical protein COO60DRAFT_1100064 [Scenedesmus sp. NREL 46B-D3]
MMAAGVWEEGLLDIIRGSAMRATWRAYKAAWSDELMSDLTQQLTTPQALLVELLLCLCCCEDAVRCVLHKQHADKVLMLLGMQAWHRMPGAVRVLCCVSGRSVCSWGEQARCCCADGQHALLAPPTIGGAGVCRAACAGIVPAPLIGCMLAVLYAASTTVGVCHKTMALQAAG